LLVLCLIVDVAGRLLPFFSYGFSFSLRCRPALGILFASSFERIRAGLLSFPGILPRRPGLLVSSVDLEVRLFFFEFSIALVAYSFALSALPLGRGTNRQLVASFPFPFPSFVIVRGVFGALVGMAIATGVNALAPF
jgi:hypothetical protein